LSPSSQQFLIVEREADNHSPTINTKIWFSSIVILFVQNTTALRKEFMKHKKYKPPDYTYDACKKHEEKNRHVYDDVICIDATRVILKDRPPEDDYIHANWMIMPDNQKYICTQGPIQETLEDFWHMSFTEKGTVIVMLCAFKEGKNEKCALYHPKTKNECGKFGPYRVYLKETRPNISVSVKHIVLCHATSRALTSFVEYSLDVHHLSCTEWPDHTAPFDAGPIVHMMKMARLLAKGNPIIVHCSAGIGRSATFIGIDYAMQKIKEDSNTSMVEVMKDLRNQRFQSIQGIIQYIFLHICVLEAFADEGIIERKGKYKKYMADYNLAAKMKQQEEKK
uniref:Protein-tyrosine phosphatase n=1 Tax=Haemonchus placei TaxID=6290 RepID=A0A0N4W9R6_HAEPC